MMPVVPKIGSGRQFNDCFWHPALRISNISIVIIFSSRPIVYSHGTYMYINFLNSQIARVAKEETLKSRKGNIQILSLSLSRSTLILVFCLSIYHSVGIQCQAGEQNK